MKSKINSLNCTDTAPPQELLNTIAAATAAGVPEFEGLLKTPKPPRTDSGNS